MMAVYVSQFEFAWPSSFMVDYINPFAEVFWSASDSLEDISALAQQIANGMTTFLRTTRRAPPDVTFAPNCVFHSHRCACTMGMARISAGARYRYSV